MSHARKKGQNSAMFNVMNEAKKPSTTTLFMMPRSTRPPEGEERSLPDESQAATSEKMDNAENAATSGESKAAMLKSESHERLR